jgi:hypothetical protein
MVTAEVTERQAHRQRDKAAGSTSILFHLRLRVGLDTTPHTTPFSNVVTSSVLSPEKLEKTAVYQTDD